MKRKISAFLLCIMFIFSSAISVGAHPVVDIEKNDCMIDVVLQNSETSEGITDAELSCIRVGKVGEDDGNFNFYHTVTGEKIEDIESISTAEAFNNEVKQNSKQFTAYSTSLVEVNGTYRFSGLPTGLYLVVQKKSATGYADMHSFLVSVPYLEDGEYKYQVTANVKTELYKELQETPKEEVKPSKPGDKLPQTGQLLWPIPLLLAAGLLMIAFGLYLRRGKTVK